MSTAAATPIPLPPELAGRSIGLSPQTLPVTRRYCPSETMDTSALLDTGDESLQKTSPIATIYLVASYSPRRHGLVGSSVTFSVRLGASAIEVITVFWQIGRLQATNANSGPCRHARSHPPLMWMAE